MGFLHSNHGWRWTLCRFSPCTAWGCNTGILRLWWTAPKLPESFWPICIETKRAKISDIRQYDTIILGGGIYASSIAGLSFLKKNIGQLQGKKIIVFCDGASPYEEKAFEQMKSHNLKDLLAGLPAFIAEKHGILKEWVLQTRPFVKRCLKLFPKRARRNAKSGKERCWKQDSISITGLISLIWNQFWNHWDNIYNWSLYNRLDTGGIARRTFSMLIWFGWVYGSE